MTLRLPLLGKILGWFFLNLVLLALVAGWLLRSEFRLEALINGAGGERFQRVADSLLGELRERPRADWTRILQRYGGTYDVQFVLADERGELVAGNPLKLLLVARETASGPKGVVVIDPRLGFGRPVIEGTGIRTEVIVDRFRAGEKIESIAEDYDRPAADIEDIVRAEMLLAA